jgi:glycosyltransferase involved in cell wall biosynthesis
MKKWASERILLLTPSDPNGSGIGSLFLRDLLAALPEGHVTVRNEPPFLLGSGKGSLAWLVRLWRRVSVRFGWLQAARLALFQWVALSSRVDAVIDQAKRDGADRIWATASSPEMIALAGQLAAKGYDLRVTVWDAPEYLANNLRLPGLARRYVLSQFAGLMRSATKAGVISHAMQRDYAERFGVQSEVIRHGIDIDRPLVRDKTREEVRIVFAGSLYSKLEWNAFVAALASIGWRVSGRPVRLYFMGEFPITGAHRPAEVTLLGHLSFHHALETMADMDIGYLPYWFAKDYELLARTSFPGKMSAYAAAGLAVFHHAPAYTEATTFLERHRFGVACAALDPEGIRRSLEQLVTFMNTQECAEARNEAFQMELSSKAMADRLRRFLASRVIEEPGLSER